MKKLIILLSAICFFAAGTVFGQSWKRGPLKDNWGEIIGYAYQQMTTGIAHSTEDISLVVGFQNVVEYKGALVGDIFTVISGTINDLEFHPAFGFVNEPITLSLRDSSGTLSYRGSTVSDAGAHNRVMISIMDAAELIKKLRGPEQWEVLIEGRNWYIRTTIYGNLPAK